MKNFNLTLTKIHVENPEPFAHDKTLGKLVLYETLPNHKLIGTPHTNQKLWKACPIYLSPTRKLLNLRGIGKKVGYINISKEDFLSRHNRVRMSSQLAEIQVERDANYLCEHYNRTAYHLIATRLGETLVDTTINQGWHFDAHTLFEGETLKLTAARKLDQYRIQDLFDWLIDAGYYDPFTTETRKFMCFAIRDAAKSGVITEEEEKLLFEAIGRYLISLAGRWNDSLENVLMQSGRDSSSAARMKIYLDWRNRPRANNS